MQFIRLTLLILLLGVTTQSHAKTPPQSLGINLLPAASGGSGPPIMINGFALSPSLGLRTRYVSNIFASEAGEEGDFIASIEPAVTVQKQVRDHQFNLSAYSNIERYKNNKSENIENYGASFYGILTGAAHLQLPFSFAYKTDHQQRNRERTGRVSKSPIQFASYKAELGGYYNPNRLHLHNRVFYEGRRYDNGQTVDGAALLREDSDTDSYGATITAAYETRRPLMPLLRLSYKRNEYIRSDRDNAEFSGLLGVRYEVSKLLGTRLAIGRQHINYDSASIDDITNSAISGNITWSPKERTAIDLSVERASEEDNIINQGVVNSVISLNIDHELKQDLFLNIGLGGEEDDFQNSSRKDRYYDTSIGLKYLISPRFELEGEYQYRTRDSNAQGLDYDQNIFMLYLKSNL
ncbi:MAG: outer membrane beta-barrel protein [Alphaproteobacteria bacterium]